MIRKESTAPGRLCHVLICITIVGALGVGIWYAAGGPRENDFVFGDVLGNVSVICLKQGSIIFDQADPFSSGSFSRLCTPQLTDFGGGFNNDPYLSDNSTSRWNNGGRQNGLRLELVNACDDSWQVEFHKVVYDWDNGDPDALTLTTTRVDVDHSCSPMDGVMKVCNGNYGETGWLGINMIISNERTGIRNSVAKMNEYYLKNAGEAARQYTMCHEIGHGFGLPHTDENFDNTDLGNCLDYTRHPEHNLHPDYSNFARLESLYGLVSRRFLLRSPGSDNARAHPPLNPRLLSASQEAMVELEQDMFTTNYGGWRLLESHRQGRKFGRYLGEGYMLHVNVLHPL